MLDAIAAHRPVPDLNAKDVPLSLAQRMRQQLSSKAARVAEPPAKLRRKPRREEHVPPLVAQPALSAEVFIGRVSMASHLSTPALRPQVTAVFPLASLGEYSVLPAEAGPMLSSAPTAVAPPSVLTARALVAQAQQEPTQQAPVVLVVPEAPLQEAPSSPVRSETEPRRDIHPPIPPISVLPPAVPAVDRPVPTLPQWSHWTASQTATLEATPRRPGLTYQFKTWGEGHAVHVERTVNETGEIGFVLDPSSVEVAQHLRDHPMMPADTHLKHAMGDGAGQHGQGAQDETPQDEDA